VSHIASKGYGPLTFEEKPQARKLEIGALRTVDPGEAEPTFAAVVRVNKPDYVPDFIKIKLRAHITRLTFTAQVNPSDLLRLAEDDAVVSIARGQRIRVE
jgi:hypothetical protein